MDVSSGLLFGFGGLAWWRLGAVLRAIFVLLLSLPLASLDRLEAFLKPSLLRPSPILVDVTTIVVRIFHEKLALPQMAASDMPISEYAFSRKETATGEIAATTIFARVAVNCTRRRVVANPGRRPFQIPRLPHETPAALGARFVS